MVAAVAEAKTRPRVVIQSSGIGHYGAATGKPVTEADGPGDDFLARLTVDWEASTAAVAQHGVRHVSIRSGVVLSPDEGALNRLLLPFRLFAGGPMGGGRQGFSWIHPADEVAAIRFLIETERASGPFNLCAPGSLSNGEFAQVLGKVMGRPVVAAGARLCAEAGAGRGRLDGAGRAAGGPPTAARPGLQVPLPGRGVSAARSAEVVKG